MIFLGVVLIIVGISGRGAQTNLSKATVRMGGEEFKVDVAENMLTREKGLSGREPLKDNEGMFFIFGYSAKHSFWMKDMKFPIDIIWIADNKIMGFEENVPPPSGNSFNLQTYSPAVPVNTVLEVRAGTVSRLGVKEGDMIEFER